MLKALTEREKVRNKITVWLDTNNHTAVMHTIRELVGNSADEINDGNGDKIDVTLFDNKTIEIKDNCQGLPVEGDVDGVPKYKLLTQQLFASTKYDNGVSSSRYTVGTNGVFLTVLAFSSAEIEFEVARPNGNVYYFSYEKGYEKEPMKIIGKSDTTYTRIKYRLDDDVYVENEFTADEIKEVLEEQSSLIQGKVGFKHIVEEEEVEAIEYEFKNGIEEFLDDKASKGKIAKVVAIDKAMQSEVKKESVGEGVGTFTDDTLFSFAMIYNKEEEDVTQLEFLNGSNLKNDNELRRSFIRGIRNEVNSFLRSNGLYKGKEKAISVDDVTYGLNYVLTLKSYFPMYVGQTKLSTEDKRLGDIVQRQIEDTMKFFAIKNPKDMEKISKKVLNSKRGREKAENIRKQVAKKITEPVTSLTSVEGFVPCSIKNAETSEFYIVEGDSALGSTKGGRNPDTQAIYALKGKTLNCAKSDIDTILKDEVIQTLLKIIGAGVEINTKKKLNLPKFNMDDLKWNKIIIATDADVDGMHIRNLLITLFRALMPTLIKEGRVYFVMSPLFEITDGADTYFAYSDEERDEILENKVKNRSRAIIQRSKGLGENTPEMMGETTMNPASRKLIRIVAGDTQEKELKRLFDMYMGNDIDSRKEYIENNLHEYIDLAYEL